jgi:hypothetical protein
MQAETLHIIFRAIAVLFFLSLGIYLWQFFSSQEKKRKNWGKVSGIVAAISLVSLFGIIFYVANNDLYVQQVRQSADNKVSESMVAKAKENYIFRDVQVFVSVFVHLIIVSIIPILYIFLWKRRRFLPRVGWAQVHKLMLILGMLSVAFFGSYVVYKCITDSEFREQIYFRTYVEYFVGNLFWMLLAAIVAALSEPDEDEKKSSKAVNGQQ